VLDRLAAEEEELQNKIKLENSEILAKQAENVKKNAGKISKSGNLHSHLLTHSLTHLLTHSLTHLLTHSLTYSLTHSLTYSLTCLLPLNLIFRLENRFFY